MTTNPLLRDGKYFASYEPVVSGDYMLHVQLLQIGGLMATYYRNADFSGAVFADSVARD